LNIIIFGKKYDIMHAIQMSELMRFRLMKFILPESTDDYIAALQKGGADMIFVAERGAKGMEAAIAAHDVCPKAALVWFADDEAFGAQSYRINCRYFTAKTVTAAVVDKALSRCLK